VDVETVTFRSGDLVLCGRLRHRAAAAPTLVLLSGVGFHTFEYEPLATELAAGGLNVLSFDFRGHGRSGGPRGRWTLDEPVADIDHFYAYERLIDDPSWVSTIRRDPLIADARRLSAGTYRELLETWDGPQAARELRMPLLVIQGRNDHLQPPRQSELVFEAARSRDGSTRYELVETGHLPHLEAPGMLAERLVAWMSEITRTS
jgi:pimeloyl-ACP methyl ester carboxylesterase